MRALFNGKYINLLHNNNILYEKSILHYPQILLILSFYLVPLNVAIQSKNTCDDRRDRWHAADAADGLLF